MTPKRRRIVSKAETKADAVSIPRRIAVREVTAGIFVETFEQSGRRFARVVGHRAGSTRPSVLVEADDIDPLISALSVVASEIAHG